jgi:putative ABC transport system permease protein
VDDQFDTITVYDMEVYFSQGQSDAQQQLFLDQVKDDVESVHFFHQSSMEMDYKDQSANVYMMVSDEGISEHMKLHRGDEMLDMPGIGEAYVSIGVTENMGIQIGDTITLRDSDMRKICVKVAGVFDNHVFNYVLMRPQTVEAQWGETPEDQMAYVQLKDGKDAHSAYSVISEMDNVLNVSVSEDLAKQVRSMLDALDMVVVTIVICAGLLAVIVLYNLTNISITERIREIATIKVLGFNSKETAAYVFKENLLLTGMGTVIGLLGGILLLEFVMSQIKVDFVWMYANLRPISYVWAVLLTGLSAVFVDFVLYFKLEKINMAEALKSVE